MSLVAGVDSSTQSTKVVIVDAAEGRVVATGSAPHAVSGHGGARESDPGAWSEALRLALAQTGRAGEVAAIAIAAQQHGLVVLGRRGEVLRPAVLWNDTRSAGEAAALVEALGGPDACARRVGSVLTASFTVTSWAWLRRHEPDIAAAAARVCLPHDYLSAELTGAEPVTDRSDASGTGWFSPEREAYDGGVLGLSEVGLELDQLPAVRGPGEPAGTVSASAAERFGLPVGALVGPGAGDNAGAALSLALAPGEAALSLGTSGTVFSVAEEPAADGTGIVAGFASADGRHLPLACTLNATLAVDRVAALFGLQREDVAPAGELVFVPWFDGERTPNLPLASGALSGLRHDTDPRAVLQAAYEGAAGTLVAALERLSHWAPPDAAAPLLLVGGGARGAVWQAVIGRLTGRALLVPEAGELVALGAAVQAAAVLEGRPPAAVADGWPTRQGTLIEPCARDEALIERLRVWTGAIVAATPGLAAVPERYTAPSDV
jgi:xylulokinase